MGTEIDDDMSVYRADDGALTALPRIVLGRSFVDEVLDVKALALVAEVADLSSGVSVVLCNKGHDMEQESRLGTATCPEQVRIFLGLHLSPRLSADWNVDGICWVLTWQYPSVFPEPP